MITPMPGCLIITTYAEEFAEDIDRLADFPLSFKACTSTEQALAEYTDETVLFGNPDMITAVLPKMPTIDWVQSSWAGVTPLEAAQLGGSALTTLGAERDGIGERLESIQRRHVRGGRGGPRPRPGPHGSVA